MTERGDFSGSIIFKPTCEQNLRQLPLKARYQHRFALRAQFLPTSKRQSRQTKITPVARHNEKPKPYRWTKSADDILASVKRFCHKTQQTLCSEL
jgi:hypothetical protein